MQEEKKKKGATRAFAIQFLVVCLVSLVLFFALAAFYVTRLSSFIQYEVQATLGEVSSQLAETIGDKINARKDLLNIIAQMPEVVDESIPLEEKMRTLTPLARRHGLVSFGMAYPNGECATTGGYSLTVQGQPYAKEAFEGAIVVSPIFVGPHGSALQMFAAPVYNRNGRIYAILFAAENIHAYGLFTQYKYLYAGRGKELIITSTGQDITSIANTNAQASFFAMLEMENSLSAVIDLKEKMHSGQHYTGALKIDEVDSYLAVVPIPHSMSWFLITYVPSAVAQERIGTLFTLTVGVMAVLLGGMCLLMLYMFFLQRRVDVQKSMAALAVDSGGLLSVSVSMSGAVLYANQAFLDLLGLAFGEEKALRLWEHALSMRKEVFLRFLKASQPFEMSFADAQNTTVFVQWTQLPDPSRRFVSLIGVNITEKKRQEEAAKRQERHQYLQSVFYNMPVPVALKSADGEIILENEAYVRENMWLETQDAMCGYDGMPTSFRHNMAVQQAFKRAQDYSTPVVCEIASPSPCNQEADPEGEAEGRRYYKITQIPLKDEKEDILSILFVALDISDSKLVEESLEKAEDATRVKSQFLATMSHEIRTPMNAIVGFTYLLEKEDLNSVQRGYLEKIRLSGNGLLRIINDILDFSKIEAGKLTMESIPFSIFAVMDGVRSIMSFNAKEKGLETSFICDPSIPVCLKGDSSRVTQILLNLVSNALKFTSNGFVHVYADLSRTYTDGTVSILFRVQDTGIGIPEEHLSRLFTAFTQADASVSRRFGGTGLGLAISKNLANLMGGDLWAESEEGKGSTFFFTMRAEVCPAEMLGEGSPSMQERSREEYAEAKANLAGKHILVVEDNEINREIAESLLDGLGLVIDMAENGEEAVRMVQETPYDLVFMDMQMPVMDGLTATRHIRALPANANTTFIPYTNLPIIAMTANAMEDDKKLCLEAGMDGHVGKPLLPESLLNALLEHFR